MPKVELRTSHTVNTLSIFKHLNSGHMVKLISTNPLPKSRPPGNRAMTSRLVSSLLLLPEAPEEARPVSGAREASSLMSSPARGAGCARILEICSV